VADSRHRERAAEFVVAADRLSVLLDNRTDRIVASSKYSQLAAAVLFLENELSHFGSEIPNCLNTKVHRRPESHATSPQS
jgi:hypothetical protein